jgi:hypothetical protein
MNYFLIASTLDNLTSPIKFSISSSRHRPRRAPVCRAHRALRHAPVHRAYWAPRCVLHSMSHDRRPMRHHWGLLPPPPVLGPRSYRRRACASRSLGTPELERGCPLHRCHPFSHRMWTNMAGASRIDVVVAWVLWLGRRGEESGTAGSF